MFPGRRKVGKKKEMTEQEKHKTSVTGNPLSIQARAPGTVFSKELLDHAVRMVEHAMKQKKKRKCKP